VWTPSQPAILQYEYTITDGKLWFDISNLDGAGASMVGTPFYTQNVKVTPTGAGFNSKECNTCIQIKCPAGQICRDAYQEPEQQATHSCPQDGSDMWLDLCEPDQYFANDGTTAGKRAFEFRA